MRSGLAGLGVGPLPPVPTASAAGAAWDEWVSSLAHVLNRDGARRLLILDDFPCGPRGSLGRRLTDLLTRTTGLRVVITCTGPPALDLARLRATGQLAHVGPDALRLDQDEVEQLLARSGVLADPATRETVHMKTEGWALGVHLAARALTGTAAAGVLDELDDVIDDVIEAEVLDRCRPRAAR